jgi:hypothetical protein
MRNKVAVVAAWFKYERNIAELIGGSDEAVDRFEISRFELKALAICRRHMVELVIARVDETN